MWSVCACIEMVACVCVRVYARNRGGWVCWDIQGSLYVSGIILTEGM